MFDKHSEDGYIPITEGVTRKTLVYGEKTLMTEFVMTGGNILPAHAHPHEQAGYLVKGRIRFTIGAEVHDVEPGDSWCVPGDVEHQAEVIEDSVAIEVFSPVREDFLPD
jgi:quercetin dioxygenase-like cupin family protein